MSHAALDRSVQTVVVPKELDTDRINFYNYRLNEHGRKICFRMQSDNLHTLLTTPGFNIFRNLGFVKVDEVDHRSPKGNVVTKKQTRIEVENCQKYAQELFYRIVDLRKYHPDVAAMYADPKPISWRSRFTSSAYFKVMNGYGHNRNKELDAVSARNLIAILNEYFRAWVTNPAFEFNLLEELNSGRWLTHIKTSSNSGYPSNIKQTKELMIPAAAAFLKIFNQWKKGERIDWMKLSFEMGYRTERKDKHRVVCMAPQYEKPGSSVIAVMLDLYAKDLPFNLTRKFGAFQNTANMFFDISGGRLLAKDYEAYDTSIPLSLIRLIRDWFKSIGNTFCDLMAFECDLIINSYMIITPTKNFYIASLPSGIGVTQFLGSIIHWIIDKLVGIESKLAFYQSDDNLCITDLNDNELNKCFEDIKNRFGMDVSPIGKKSDISINYNKFLQKIIDREHKVYYNQEQRAYTNALFREREITEDTLFEQIFMLDAESPENRSKKAVLAYLGNIVSLGQYAPSLCNILSVFYGRKNTGFTLNQMKWGLNNIESYITAYLGAEQHRPIESPGWASGLIQSCLDHYGWITLTADKIQKAADLVNLKLYASVI